MSNTLLESLWSRIDANIGSRIRQISDLLAQALSASTEVAADASATAAHREHVDNQVTAIDTAFTESIPPYLQPDAPGGLKETYSVASEEMVNALRYVKGDGTDETAQLQAAADAARSSGRGLCLPGGVSVRINGEVSLRFIDNLDLRGGIVVGPEGLLLCGSNSVLRRGMKIHIRSVTLASRSTQTNVALRFVGVKGAYIDVRNCDSMEFFADDSDSTIASISYNTISLGQIRKLSIRGVGDRAWITQLLFLGGDIKDLTVSGDYGHNEIMFVAPCFEGGYLDFQVGTRIRAVNARCEDGTQIRFGRRATLNVIEDSYTPHSGVFNPTAKVVEDLGLGNQVISTRLTYMKSHELTSIDSRSLIFNQARNHKGEGVVPGVNTLTVSAWSWVLDTGIMPIREKSWTGRSSSINWDMSNFLIVSDKPNWRFYVDLYDEDGVMITDESVINTSDGWRQAESGGFYFQASVDAARVVVTGRDVAAIRIRARAGSETAPFKFLRLIGYTQSADTDYPVELWRNELTQGLYQPTRPTRGFAPVGTVVEGGDDRWVVTWSSKSSLLTGSDSGANELQLKDSPAAMAGDILGVELSNGATHWTTISGIDGDLVTLLSPIPSGAAGASPVSITRWSP